MNIKENILLNSGLNEENSSKKEELKKAVNDIESLLGRVKSKKISAVDNISLDVFPGETVGIVGESGCGKTSLGKAVLNLISDTQGSIYFKGTEIRKLKGKSLKNFRKKVQVVFQDPYSSLNPVQTAGEIITEPMKVHLKHLSSQERMERCRALMEKAGLSADSISRYPHQFSGGQRQRIGIARCLALEPEMIILDESVSSLDVSVQAQILNLLNDLKKELGLTYIFISHDLAVVKYMSDRIIIMKDGKVEETGEESEISDLLTPSLGISKLGFIYRKQKMS